MMVCPVVLEEQHVFRYLKFPPVSVSKLAVFGRWLVVWVLEWHSIGVKSWEIVSISEENRFFLTIWLVSCTLLHSSSLPLRRVRLLLGLPPLVWIVCIICPIDGGRWDEIRGGNGRNRNYHHRFMCTTINSFSVENYKVFLSRIIFIINIIQPCIRWTCGGEMRRTAHALRIRISALHTYACGKHKKSE